MATPASFAMGVAAMYIGIVVSIVLMIGIALPAELTVKSFEEITVSGAETVYDISAPWNMGYSDTVFWMNIMYIIMICPALLGIIIMFASAIKTQDYDVFSEPQEYTGQMSTQYVTAEELAFRRGQ